MNKELTTKEIEDKINLLEKLWIDLRKTEGGKLCDKIDIIVDLELEIEVECNK